VLIHFSHVSPRWLVKLVQCLFVCPCRVNIFKTLRLLGWHWSNLACIFCGTGEQTYRKWNFEFRLLAAWVHPELNPVGKEDPPDRGAYLCGAAVFSLQQAYKMPLIIMMCWTWWWLILLYCFDICSISSMSFMPCMKVAADVSCFSQLVATMLPAWSVTSLAACSSTQKILQS